MLGRITTNRNSVLVTDLQVPQMVSHHSDRNEHPTRHGHHEGGSGGHGGHAAHWHGGHEGMRHRDGQHHDLHNANLLSQHVHELSHHHRLVSAKDTNAEAQTHALHIIDGTGHHGRRGEPTHLDFNPPNFHHSAAAVAGLDRHTLGTSNATGDSNTQPISQHSPLKGLDDPRIEKNPNADKDSEGKTLKDRSPQDVTNLEIRIGHKQGDAPPNYIVDDRGHVKEVRSPNKKLDDNDHSIVVELQPGAGSPARLLETTKQLTDELKKTYPNVEKKSDAQTPNDAPPATPPQPAADAGSTNYHSGSSHAGYDHGGGGTGGGRSYSGGDSGGYHPHLPGGRSSSGGGSGSNSETSFNGQPLSGDRLAQLEALGLNPNDPYDKLMIMLSMSEGGLQSIAWNDAGAGVSVGFYQANQGGDLAALFNEMYKANPDKFRSIFGQYTDQVLNAQTLKGLHFAPDNALGQALVEALKQPEFEKAEITRNRERMHAFAQEAKDKYGVISEEGVALYTYMMNWGPALAQRYFKAAAGVEGQAGKIQAVVEAAQAGGNGEAVKRMNATIARAQSLGLDATDTIPA
jgi:hypothetical protein